MTEHDQAVQGFMRLIRYGNKELLEEILIVLDDPVTEEAIAMRKFVDSLNMTVDKFVHGIRTMEKFPWPDFPDDYHRTYR